MWSAFIAIPPVDVLKAVAPQLAGRERNTIVPLAAVGANNEARRQRSPREPQSRCHRSANLIQLPQWKELK